MAKITSTKLDKVETKEKDKYRVTNWSSYNKSLVNRGDITIWIEEEAISNWYYEGPNQRGAQIEYSDLCIECLLQLKMVFKLPYRQLQGFSTSLIRLMGFDVEIPCYTQICRRSAALDIDIEVPKSKVPIYIDLAQIENFM